MRSFLSIAVYVSVSSLFVASAAKAEFFGDLYAEGVYLGAAKTTAGLMNLRAGDVPLEGLEVYGVSRLGGDTRTYLETSDSVYNDNFMFLGAGVDYLGLLPGVRMSFQIGGSFDLNSKINREGFDLRTGVFTYHETPGPTEEWLQEIYSESLYVRRYRNFLASLQWRLVYNGWSAGDWELSPLGSMVMSVDSQGFDYNRFVELRGGFRFRNREWANLAFQPMYVAGARWNADDVTRASYQEFRFLVTMFTAF